MTTHDIVLRGGRVIDPETGLDAIADVAVSGGRITEIGNGLAAAAVDLNVAGHVVTAGFIDLHSHTADIAGLRLRALDGVTTALELEAGVTPVGSAYRQAAAEGRPINYGFAASWALARMEAVGGIALDGGLGTFLANIATPAWQGPAIVEPRSASSWAGLSADLADGAHRHRNARRLRARHRAGRVSPGRGPGRRSRRPDLHPCPRPHRARAERAHRRRRGDRPRGRRDRRADALLPYQQHVAPAHRPGPGAGGAGRRRRVRGYRPRPIRTGQG